MLLLTFEGKTSDVPRIPSTTQSRLDREKFELGKKVTLINSEKLGHMEV